MIEIEGAPTDNNATLFHNGQENILKPLYDNGTLKLVQSQPIDNWDNQQGGTTFEQILTSNGGKVDGVVAANDGLAGAIITVLTKYGLNGKVPVTGQDATPDGLQAILARRPVHDGLQADRPGGRVHGQARRRPREGRHGRRRRDRHPDGEGPDGQPRREVGAADPAAHHQGQREARYRRRSRKASEICVAATQAACDQLGIK